jgi:hypothetical protein
MLTGKTNANFNHMTDSRHHSVCRAATITAPATAFLFWHNTFCSHWLHMHYSVSRGCRQQGQPSGFGATFIEYVQDQLSIEGSFQINQLQLQIPLRCAAHPETVRGVTLGLEAGGPRQIVRSSRSQHTSGQSEILFCHANCSLCDMQHFATFFTTLRANHNHRTTFGGRLIIAASKPRHLRDAAIAHEEHTRNRGFLRNLSCAITTFTR